MRNKTKIEFDAQPMENGLLCLKYRKSYLQSKLPKWLLSIIDFFNYWRIPHIFQYVEINRDTTFNSCLKKIVFKDFEEYLTWYYKHNFQTFGEFYSYYWDELTIREYENWINRFRIVNL